MLRLQARRVLVLWQSLDIRGVLIVALGGPEPNSRLLGGTILHGFLKCLALRHRHGPKGAFLELRADAPGEVGEGTLQRRNLLADEAQVLHAPTERHKRGLANVQRLAKDSPAAQEEDLDQPNHDVVIADAALARTGRKRMLVNFKVDAGRHAQSVPNRRA